MKIGLDFGTTNSSLSILANNKVTLLPIDEFAQKPEVIRSALYFYPQKLIISDTATEAQLKSNIFRIDQISYEGEAKTLFGSKAVEVYMNDNKLRKQGVLRQIFTGRTFELITWINPYSGKIYKEDIPEVLEEMDYGIGRLFHALKTALKSSYYKGSTVFGKYYSLEELIGMFVLNIKKRAESIIDEKIEQLVVGRPVFFSEDPAKDKFAQSRLEEGIKNAGIKDIRFEYEPIGAAKYFVHENPDIQGNILIFDFGGGTLDTTLLNVNNHAFKVLVNDGVYIGGDLFNSDIFSAKLGKYFGTKIKWGDTKQSMPSRFINALASWFSIPNLNNAEDIRMLENIKKQCDDPEAINRLLYLIKTNLSFEIYEAIEFAKKQLTSQDESMIFYKNGIIDFNIKITKTEFEKIISERMDDIKDTVLRTLKRGGLKPIDIQAVVATGGSSSLPIVKTMLSGVFGKEKINFFELFTSIAAGLVL